MDSTFFQGVARVTFPEEARMTAQNLLVVHSAPTTAELRSETTRSIENALNPGSDAEIVNIRSNARTRHMLPPASDEPDAECSEDGCSTDRDGSQPASSSDFEVVIQRQVRVLLRWSGKYDRVLRVNVDPHQSIGTLKEHIAILEAVPTADVQLYMGSCAEASHLLFDATTIADSGILRMASGTLFAQVSPANPSALSNVAIALDTVEQGPAAAFGWYQKSIGAVNIAINMLEMPYRPDITIDDMERFVREHLGLGKLWRPILRLADVDGPIPDTRMTLAECNVSAGDILRVGILVVPALPEYNIFVRTSTGKTIPISVTAAHTTENIRELIERREGIPPHQQTLLFAGKELIAGVTMGEYGIDEDDIVRLTLRLRGD